MVTSAARREAVAHLRSSFGVSERRACGALGADRSSVRYHARCQYFWDIRVEPLRNPHPMRGIIGFDKFDLLARTYMGQSTFQVRRAAS